MFFKDKEKLMDLTKQLSHTKNDLIEFQKELEKDTFDPETNMTLIETQEELTNIIVKLYDCL